MIFVTDCICGGTSGPIIGPPHPWLIHIHCPIHGSHINDPKDWCETCHPPNPAEPRGRVTSW